jgi:hypothetical protein
VADREVALERGETALVEHLGHEAHVLDHGDRLAVAHRDAGRLLAPVLERVQPQVREMGDGLARRVDTEHTAGVVQPRSGSGIHRSILPPFRRPSSHLQASRLEGRLYHHAG